MGESLFPIRYGVLECFERINYTPVGTPEFFDIKVYIACKCYVMSEVRKYRRDGSVEEHYEVVYFYRKNGDMFLREEPLFNGNNCNNAIPAGTLYSDFEMASRAADELNRESFKTFATTVPYDSNFSLKVKTGKQSFDKLLETYKEHESRLENQTKEFSEFVKRFSL